MAEVEVNWLETINDREAGLILAILKNAKSMIRPRLIEERCELEDIEKLISKLEEFRIRIRAIKSS